MEIAQLSKSNYNNQLQLFMKAGEHTSSLWQSQRPNQGYVVMLPTYTLQPMSIPNINFLHLTVSETQPGQDFIRQSHYRKIKCQINSTL